MDYKDAIVIFENNTKRSVVQIERCSVGIANYVFIVSTAPLDATSVHPESYDAAKKLAELLAEQVRHVTAERIFDAMQTVSLDTVYFLKGKETAE